MKKVFCSLAEFREFFILTIAKTVNILLYQFLKCWIFLKNLAQSSSVILNSLVILASLTREASQGKWKYCPLSSPDLQKNRDLTNPALVTFPVRSPFGGSVDEEKTGQNEDTKGPKKGRSEPWAGLPPCITAGQDSKCLACHDGITLKEHNDF